MTRMREHLSSIPVPTWASGGVFYHIYPLGFLGAPPTNDGVSSPEPRLVELRRWYDHIKGLGVTALYLGPVFESLSHGYDTTDYFTVDRRLGDNEVLRQIVEELHGLGIRVILDGVFNHTGREFFAFRDIREKGRESPYHDWYHINWGADSDYRDGFSYDSFEGHQSLPRLNLGNPRVRRYVLDVARNWLDKFGIDGWRLDVAHQIDPEFWWEFRRECKAVNPDCFLLGELVHGDYRTWVAPDLLDSGTNYQLYYAMIAALNNNTLEDLSSAAERSYNSEFGVYAELPLVNFLGNHDVSRIASILNDSRKVAPALVFLLTMPGIPCIYYGEEIGMNGTKGPYSDADLRRPMITPDGSWPDPDRYLYRLASQLARIRTQHPPLRFGSFAVLQSGPTTLAYLRQHATGWAIGAINIGDESVSVTLPVGRAGIPDGVRFSDSLWDSNWQGTVEQGGIHVEVPPFAGMVLTSA